MEVVEDIIDSQFLTATKAMKEGVKGEPETFKNIIFLHLGKLIAKPNRVKWLKQLSEQKRKRDQSTEDENNSEQSVVRTNQPT